MGVRLLEVLVFRESALKGKREIRILGMLNLIHTTVWKVGWRYTQLPCLIAADAVRQAG